jgi:hypothetical protein
VTTRELAEALNCSVGSVINYKREGMPIGSVELAERWLACRLTARRKPIAANVNKVFAQEVDVDGESLAHGIPRLRKVEKATSEALERALAADRIMESVLLRREHVTALRALYDAEAKLLKINQARGKLVSTDRALGMINEAIQSAVQVLRRLPELGRDQAERQRLEAFMNAVLNEIKLGAGEGFRNGA